MCCNERRYFIVNTHESYYPDNGSLEMSPKLVISPRWRTDIKKEGATLVKVSGKKEVGGPKVWNPKRGHFSVFGSLLETPRSEHPEHRVGVRDEILKRSFSRIHTFLISADG